MPSRRKAETRARARRRSDDEVGEVWEEGSGRVKVGREAVVAA